MRITRTHAAVLGLILVTTLGGCGGSAAEEPAGTRSEVTSETDPADGPSEETAPAEDPEEVTIERAAFCDQMDPALVESALGAPSQWLEERKPGDTYEILDQRQKSETFYCRWQTNRESESHGADDAMFLVTIHGKPATPALVDAQFAERTEYLENVGEALGCQEADVTFGARSLSQVCTLEGDRYNDPNSSASVLGVFGDSLVLCYVLRNGPGEAAQVRGVLEDVCGQLPTALSSH